MATPNYFIQYLEMFCNRPWLFDRLSPLSANLLLRILNLMIASAGKKSPLPDCIAFMITSPSFNSLTLLPKILMPGERDENFIGSPEVPVAAKVKVRLFSERFFTCSKSMICFKGTVITSWLIAVASLKYLLPFEQL